MLKSSGAFPTVHTMNNKKKVSVAINVYKESLLQITQCLERISQNLPEAKVAVFFDGVQRSDVSDLARSLGFLTVLGENCGRNETWYLWWLRMLYFFDWSDAEICLKLDPDTMVDAAPCSFPEAHYFGDIVRTFIQGGVTGLSGKLVRFILDKKLLEPVENGSKPWLKLEGPHFADDTALAIMLRHIGIYPEQWNECRSRWKHPVPNSPIVYSIVHPRYYR